MDLWNHVHSFDEAEDKCFPPPNGRTRGFPGLNTEGLSGRGRRMDKIFASTEPVGAAAVLPKMVDIQVGHRMVVATFQARQRGPGGWGTCGYHMPLHSSTDEDVV